jgi:hypothetical protein
MGASRSRGMQQPQETKTVEREVVTPATQESTVEMGPVNRMAGQTWLDAARSTTPVTRTVTTPGTVTRTREEVPVESPQPFKSTGNPIFDLFLRGASAPPRR